MYAIWGMGDRCLFSWCVLSCLLFPQRGCTGASTGQYADGISAPILSPFCLSPDPWRLFRGDLWQILQCELVALVAWVVMTHRWGYSSPAKPLPAMQPLFSFFFHSSVYLFITKERNSSQCFMSFGPHLTFYFFERSWSPKESFSAFAPIISHLGSDIIQM